jgi:TRAP-type C4-dicarboxylate transport system permease small subunit
MLLKIQKWMDTILTGISCVLLAVMFFVIVANVILRLIPAVGGFSWYMEFAQYSNVWAMLIGAAGIAVMGTNLRVEAVDSLVSRFPWGYKVTRVIIDVAELVFYVVMTHSGFLLATKAKQKVSTMPRFTMGQVYWIFPIAGVLCIIAVLVHLAITLSSKSADKEEA